jgi:hypothetical protein
MKLFARTAAGALVCALLSGSLHADPHKTVKAADREKTSWLSIQTSRGATFDGKTLVLTNVDPAVVMFSDRPTRIAESVPLADFLRAWDSKKSGGFEADPPNAGITFIADGNMSTASVELKQPHLTGTTLTYQVRVLQGKLPPNLGTSSLFVDGGCNPWDPRC